MDDRTDTSSGNHRLRFELIFASVWLALGFFLLPAVIFWVGVALLGPYGEGQGAGMGTFYGDFYADLASGEGRAWSLALGPLVLISILRAIFLGARQKTQTVPTPMPQTASAAPSKIGDPRRVEPRIGAE